MTIYVCDNPLCQNHVAVPLGLPIYIDRIILPSKDGGKDREVTRWSYSNDRLLTKSKWFCHVCFNVLRMTH